MDKVMLVNVERSIWVNSNEVISVSPVPDSEYPIRIMFKNTHEGKYRLKENMTKEEVYDACARWAKSINDALLANRNIERF